jgi:transposase
LTSAGRIGISDVSSASPPATLWYEIVEDDDVPELGRLATTVTRWETEILNWFDSRFTNGPTEGRNPIIKTVKRSGFGFRNFNHYRLRVLYGNA